MAKDNALPLLMGFGALVLMAGSSRKGSASAMPKPSPSNGGGTGFFPDVTPATAPLDSPGYYKSQSHGGLKATAQKQVALKLLGAQPGVIDGKWGDGTKGAIGRFQQSRGLEATGQWSPQTEAAVRDALLDYQIAGIDQYGILHFTPGSPEQKDLFIRAAAFAGYPQWWGSSSSLAKIIEKESGGWVGRINYTYGSAITKDKARWPQVWNELKHGELTAEGKYSSIMGKTLKSSATGLGQALLSTADNNYPAARFGIGVPMQEAVGMLTYIKRAYGDPDKALNCYGIECNSPPCTSKYGSGMCTRKKTFKEGY